LTSHNFRHDARQSIARAKGHLVESNAGDLTKLRYAALDARLAMEALTYERAQSYQQELPKGAHETWQPRKLMQMLLDVDPTADKDSSLRIGREEIPGKPANIMNDLGAETVLNLSILKHHYDALGSYLHMPTLKQIQAEGTQSSDRLHARLQEIVSYVDRVLKSPIFNINFGTFATIDCKRCGHIIHWRMPRSGGIAHAVCRECSASYDVKKVGDNEVQWKPLQLTVPCANVECGTTGYLWNDDVKPGMVWTCAVCERRNEIVLSVQPFPTSTAQKP
jgi:hypothetical protein